MRKVCFCCCCFCNVNPVCAGTKSKSPENTMMVKFFSPLKSSHFLPLQQTGRRGPARLHNQPNQCVRPSPSDASSRSEQHDRALHDPCLRHTKASTYGSPSSYCWFSLSQHSFCRFLNVSPHLCSVSVDCESTQETTMIDAAADRTNQRLPPAMLVKHFHAQRCKRAGPNDVSCYSIVLGEIYIAQHA